MFPFLKHLPDKCFRSSNILISDKDNQSKYKKQFFLGFGTPADVIGVDNFQNLLGMSPFALKTACN